MPFRNKRKHEIEHTIMKSQDEEEHVVLNRRQRMQIRIRKLQRKNPPLLLVIAAAVILLGASIVVARVIPSFAVNTYTQPSEDTLLVMDFVGDIMLGRNIAVLGEKNGYDTLFAGTQGYWDGADLVFANLENAVLQTDAGDYEEVAKNIHLSCNYEALDAAAAAGINMFACANNHTYDYGAKAITELINYFRANEIAYAGIGYTIEDADDCVFLEINGITVAFVSMSDTYPAGAMATESEAGILTVAYTGSYEVVYNASQIADITIVYMHWGEENEISANDEQMQIGHRLIDSGADIVIGSHPHVMQEVEEYRGGIIFYSLGNFLFDQGNSFSKDSVMVQFTLDANGNGQFELIPMRLIDGVPYETANLFYKARINRELSQSLDEGSYYYDADGHIIIPAITVDVEAEQVF